MDLTSYQNQVKIVFTLFKEPSCTTPYGTIATTTMVCRTKQKYFHQYDISFQLVPINYEKPMYIKNKVLKTENYFF